MIPNKSNNNNGCTDNISSNCVVWQGPDLTCVNVCQGDTVSDVVAKFCDSLVECCEQSGVIDISTVNQYCLIEDYGQATTLQSLLNNIIDKVCRCCDSNAPGDGRSNDPAPGFGPCDCVMPIPECLRKSAQDYLNTTSPVTSMVLHNNTTGKGYAHFLAERLCNLSSALGLLQSQVNNIDARVTYIEQNCCDQSVQPPVSVVAPNSTGTNRPQRIDSVVVALDETYGVQTRALGTADQLTTAVAYTPAYSQRKVLSGTGVMAGIRGWITNPKNMAQSFQNLWITMNDTRNAVENLSETVGKPSCSDIIYDVKASINKDSGGSVKSLVFDFQGTSLPTTFTQCNSRGTKITITDASLNTVTKYIDLSSYQNNAPYSLPTEGMGNLDLGSNYSVRVDFCTSDGDTTCQEIQNFTIENELSCGSVVIGTVTADTIPFTVSASLPANKGYIVTTELLTRTGSLINSRSNTWHGTTITGSFTNLNSNTQYQVRSVITQEGSTRKTECPMQLVSTTEPVCSTVIYTSASPNWKTSTADLQMGADTVTIATYNDGATQTKWQVGFDNTNTPIVTQAATTGTTGWVHNGSFINDELTTTPLTISGLTGSPVAPTGIVRSNLESGWKYLGTITSPNGKLYYLYASIDTTAHRVIQVVFSCTCDGLYIDSKQPVYYAKTSETIEVELEAVGYTQGGGTFTWNIATQPSNGSLRFKSGSPTAGKAVYEYTQDGTTMSSDSFVVTLTNDCGTSIGSHYIPILPAREIRYTTSDVIVFFDENSINIDDAKKIKASFNAVRAGFSSVTKPNFYYVAVNNTESGDYLKHVKACVENIGTFTDAGTYGAAISMPSTGAWYTDVMESGATLPSYWSGADAEYPPDIKVISFVNQVNANSTYGKSSVPATPVWTTPNEPTTSSGAKPAQYQEDYDAIIDITSSAAPTSAWGLQCQAQTNFPWVSGSIPFTVSQVVVPIISDTAGTTASVSLQAFAALQGATLLSLQEYNGTALGLERYRSYVGFPGIDLSKYLLTGVAPTNIPYSVTTHGASNTMVGLKDTGGLNYSMAVHSYIENGTEFDNTVNSIITTYFRGMFGLAATGSAGEPTNLGAQRMGGTSTYANHAGSATDACTAAKTATNLRKIYNVSGVEFDVTQRAYTTLSAAVNAQSEYELVNGRWYANGPGSTGVKVAQYSTTAPYWTGVTTCP